MRARAMLAVVMMGVAVAAPVAHAAHWERAPNGALVCPGSYPGIGAQGQLIEVCPPDPISPEQADKYRREYNERARADQERMNPFPHSRGVECSPPRADVPDTRPANCFEGSK